MAHVRPLEAILCVNGNPRHSAFSALLYVNFDTGDREKRHDRTG